MSALCTVPPMRCAAVTAGRLGLGGMTHKFVVPSAGVSVSVKRSFSSNSIYGVIGSSNGEEWLARCNRVREWITPSSLQQHVTLNYKNEGEELAGQGVYAKEGGEDVKTRYDVVNAWQGNYARVLCTTDGKVVGGLESCSDDDIYRGFHSKRPGSRVLDVGCNTGKNLSLAAKHGGPDTELWGIEYSQDSVEIAQATHGTDRIFQGDATTDFATNHGWSNFFDAVQCNFVIQHMQPEQVERVFGNVAKCLRSGGEFLMNFKDAPTEEHLQRFGMHEWAHEVFTADLASAERYFRDGFIHAVMWDDDYYPGVASSSKPVVGRDLHLPGLHRREFFFYSLEWVKARTAEHGLVLTEVEAILDAKIPRSAFAWQVVLRKEA